MSAPVGREELMRYLDGELPPDERARVEAAVERSTELGRELEIFRAMKMDLAELSFAPHARERSVWERVNRRLARPLGWVLIAAGGAVWTVYGAWVWATSPAEPWEKLATGAIVIGVLVLLATVIVEQYRDYPTDPYRDVQR